MNLLMFGLSHQTAPVEIRELFACSREEVSELLREWSSRFPDDELVPVFTCNRTELYVGTGNGTLPDENDIWDFLCQMKGQGREDTERKRLTAAREYFQVLSGAEAVEHLFQVISSLNSMVVGEPQIISQVKNAYQTAADGGTAGAVTHAAFQTALKVAKRISSETDLFHHRVSIPSVAVVDFALNIFERLSDKRTVVLGAGEMARETVQYLLDNGAKYLTIVNRSLEKAKELADEFGGEVCVWEERQEAVAQADILVAATAADQFILTAEQCRTIAKKRPGKPLFMLDLCVPRNIDPACAEGADVYLYSLDDLQEACQRNRNARDQELPKAFRIVKQETEIFEQEMRRRDTGDVIRQLRLTWNSVKEEELHRLFNKCPQLDEKTTGEIRYAFDRMVNKLLHPPMESLKDESRDAAPGRLVEAIRRLFRL